jgi:hypothetical protein
MVMTFLDNSSTIRDFPVPDELTIHVCLAYTFLSKSRELEIVARRTSAALPSYLVSHASTAARMKQSTINHTYTSFNPRDMAHLAPPSKRASLVVFVQLEA